MKTIGNVLWFLFGGLLSGLSWCIAGLFWCVTIVGIPIGKQCFKFAKLSFSPFGKEIRFKGGMVSALINVIWVIFSGLPMALENALFGLLWCITIVGIPFGKQFFKLAKLSLMPFGAEIVSSKKAGEE
ncbi:MAG: YccF domain-containing protein [Clostridia bacterium]|nr:YccF domain-containing protein [Clostridia bacterium]